jgi:hypothetical protein
MSENRPWWQDNIGTIVRAASIVLAITGVVWAGGAWMSSHDQSKKATASTLDKVDKRVQTVEKRVSKNEGEIDGLRRDSKRLYKGSKRLEKAVTDLKVVTSELKVILQHHRDR